MYILSKTIEGYGFYIDFIAKCIFFSTQIINRYVAEPSLCKHSINFSRCLEALLADLQKRWNTPKIKVITAPFSIQFSHSPPLTGSFKCKTALIIKMSTLLCLKRTLGKFQKYVYFGIKHIFLPFFFSFKMFSFALKSVFECALWFAQHSAFFKKMCCQMFLIT